MFRVSGFRFLGLGLYMVGRDCRDKAESFGFSGVGRYP